MLFGYYYLTSKRLVTGSKLWLVGGSLFFYGYWDVVYIPLLLLSVFVNFLVGTAIVDLSDRERKYFRLLKQLSSKQLLVLGIVFNITLLAYFKYTDFLIENFNGIFGANIPLPHIVLPLGISFFTFTQIAFLVDAYKNEVKKYDLLNFMLFVTYFPHLLAGPILHHKEMMPQFANKWNFAVRWRNIAIGLFLFSIGLFKKVVIADAFAKWADAGFDTALTLNLIEAWGTSLSYTLQLYFDFSGYTDMAIGMSLMFNIRMPINFNSPYKAINIQDFWRRWHITLSRFLQDYIYIPLGGNKVSRLRNYVNLFTVFLIGGLWHGASWMFVIWGALHGIAIVIHRLCRDFRLRINKYIAWFITFNFVNIAWVFFRSKDYASAMKVLGGMAGCAANEDFTFSIKLIDKLSMWINIPLYNVLPYSFKKSAIDEKAIIYCLIFMMIAFFSKNSSNYYLNSKVSIKMIITAAFAFSYSIILSFYSSTKVFLYFNF
jgi:alginate O-acetyltransferase complex protein AlgI